MPGGNITSKKEYAYTTGTLGSVLSTKTYSYGSTAWKDKLTSYDGNSLSYDSMGNLTSDGEWTYNWEHGSQLSGMTKTGTDAAFGYNADGLRTQKTVNGTTTKYFYAGDQLTFINRSGNKLHFVYDSFGPATVTYNSTVYYYLRNAQGDITGITDNTGAGVVYYFYDAWGNPTSVSGSMANTLGKYNPFRYRGYVYDEETGLYYLNSRYYDPELCRFISADSLAVPTISPGSASWDKNLYAYCDNNPVTRKDAGGNVWVPMIIAGAAIGAITGAGFSALNDYVSGRDVSFESVMRGAAVGAFNGALGGLTYEYKIAATAGSLIGTFASSLISGSDFGDAVLNASTAAATTFLSVTAGNVISPEVVKTATSLIAGTSASYVISLMLEGPSTMLRVTCNTFNRNSTTIYTNTKMNDTYRFSAKGKLSAKVMYR